MASMRRNMETLLHASSLAEPVNEIQMSSMLHRELLCGCIGQQCSFCLAFIRLTASSRRELASG